MTVFARLLGARAALAFLAALLALFTITDANAVVAAAHLLGSYLVLDGLIALALGRSIDDAIAARANATEGTIELVLGVVVLIPAAPPLWLFGVVPLVWGAATFVAKLRYPSATARLRSVVVFVYGLLDVALTLAGHPPLRFPFAAYALVAAAIYALAARNRVQAAEHQRV